MNKSTQDSVKVGDLVLFELDGNAFHRGQGKVTHLEFQGDSNIVLVTLNHPVKEYATGANIAISRNEIMMNFAKDYFNS